MSECLIPVSALGLFSSYLFVLFSADGLLFVLPYYISFCYILLLSLSMLSLKS